jgi:hypothetical protein
VVWSKRTNPIYSAGRTAVITVPVRHESQPLCFASVNIRSLLTVYKEIDGCGAVLATVSSFWKEACVL